MHTVVDGGQTRRRLTVNAFGRKSLACGVLALTCVASLGTSPVAGATQPYEAYEQAVAADGPIAQFRFNDAEGSGMVADSVGSYSATNHGVRFNSPGPFNGSRYGYFGGEPADAFAELPSSPLNGQSEYTIEGWVKWLGNTGGEPILYFGSSSSNYMLLTPYSYSSPARLLFEIHTSKGATVQLRGSSWLPKEWSYVAVTETASGTITLFLDGNQVAQALESKISPASLGATADTWIGKSQLADPVFVGDLSNVAYYTKALSAERIKAHFDTGEAPIGTSTPSIRGEPADESRLEAYSGAWTGLEPITFGYQWVRCNELGQSCGSIAGATGVSYTATHEDVGHKLKVAVNASNSAGSAAAESSAQLIQASRPRPKAKPLISGTTADEQTLLTSAGDWLGTPPFTYRYEWLSCNSAGVSCAAISGATMSNYTLTHGEVGKTVKSKVYAENSKGREWEVSTASAVISAIKPRNSAAPTISGTDTDGQALTANLGIWSGTPTIVYAYQWQLCSSAGETCADIGGATDATYVLGSEDVGSRIRLVVTAANTAGEATAYSATTAVIHAVAPSNIDPPTIAGSPKVSQQLSATTGSWNGSTPMEYSYQWQRCNGVGESCSIIPGATSSRYTIVGEEIGQTIRAAITAKNAAGAVIVASIPSSKVAAEAPANTAPPTISGEATDESMLIASPGTWTGSPTIAYSYQWQSCNGVGEACSSISGAASSSYTIGHEQVGKTIRVKITAANSGGEASVTSIQTAPIALSAPANTGLPVLIGEPQVGKPLTFTTGSWTGTPPIEYSYQWQGCAPLVEGCSNIPGATSATYLPKPADVGLLLRVRVSARNSAGEFSAASAPSAAVAEAGCSDQYIGSSGGNWHAASNWSAGRIPTTSDVACVSPGVTVQVTEGANIAGKLLAKGIVQLSGGSLQLGEGPLGAEASSAAILTLNGGTLSLPGNLDVSSSLSVGQGTSVDGPGTLLTEPGSTGVLTGGTSGSCTSTPTLRLNGATLANEGTLTLGKAGSEIIPGAILMENGSQLRNTGTFNDDSWGETCPYGWGSFFTTGGAAPQITNTGTFNINAAIPGFVWEGASHAMSINVAFANQGTVNVESGKVPLTVGGSSADGAIWTASEGATLYFEGGSFALSEASFTGSGNIGVNGASVTATDLTGSANVGVSAGALTLVAGSTNSASSFTLSGGTLSLPEGSTTSASSVGLNGGTLSLSGNLDVSSSLSAGQGTSVDGPGTLLTEPGSTGVLTGGTSGSCTSTPTLRLNGATLANEGTLTLGKAGSEIIPGAILMENGARLRNSGTFNDDSWGHTCPFGWYSVFDNGGAAPQITNTGTFNINAAIPGFVWGREVNHSMSINVPLDNSGILNDQAGLSELTSLSLSGGSLSIAEGLSLWVLRSFAGGGASSIEGLGTLAIGSGVTGTLGTSCSTLRVNEAKLLNVGDLTFGASGGAPDGTIQMENGAELVNYGTFRDDAYNPGCQAGTSGYSIYNAGGKSPAIINRGHFDTSVGAQQAAIGVKMTNEGGLFDAESGTVELSGGGVSSGTGWTASAGATIGFSGGSYEMDGGEWYGPGRYLVNGAGVNMANVIGGLNPTLQLTTGSLELFTFEVGGPAGDELGGFTVGSLNISGGRLAVTASRLGVKSRLVLEGDPTLSGGGSIGIDHGASGTIGGAGECSGEVTLERLSLVNNGELTFGVPGGTPAGSIAMKDGARFENRGSFADDAYDAGCQPGKSGYSFYDAGGAAPSILNTGNFQSNVGPRATNVGVNFGNDGHVEAVAGRLELSDGGLPEYVGPEGLPQPQATGSWSRQEGASIALTGGLFMFVGPVELQSVNSEGATVEQAPWSHGEPTLVEGEMEVGDSVTAEPGSWSGAPTPLIAYQWQRCTGGLASPQELAVLSRELNGEGYEQEELFGAGLEHESMFAPRSCEDLLGATSSSYRLQQADEWASVRVIVTAINRLGNESSVSEPSWFVLEDPPLTRQQFEGRWLASHGRIDRWAEKHHMYVRAFDECANAGYYATLMEYTANEEMLGAFRVDQQDYQREYAECSYDVVHDIGPTSLELSRATGAYQVIKTLVHTAIRLLGY